MKLLIDTHEPKKVQRYAEQMEFETEVKPLPVGDIVFEEKGIVVERKEIGDWVGSIRSGHLQKQLQQMINFPHPYLIISGKTQDLHFGGIKWTAEQHAGSLASCMVRYPNLKVMFVENDKQLVRLVKKIIEKTDDGKSISIYDTELLRNQVTEEDMRVKLLTNFPGLGVIKSRKLLDKDEEVKQKVIELVEMMKNKGLYK